jgi:hypothetical protein
MPYSYTGFPFLAVWRRRVGWCTKYVAHRYYVVRLLAQRLPVHRVIRRRQILTYNRGHECAHIFEIVWRLKYSVETMPFGRQQCARSVRIFNKSSLWIAGVIASLAVGSAINAVAAENAVIPNFASAEFGWLLQGGIDFRPIPGDFIRPSLSPTAGQSAWRDGADVRRREPKSEALGPGADAQVQSRCVERPSGFLVPIPLLARRHTRPIAFPG